jgi:hypothetical protein
MKISGLLLVLAAALAPQSHAADMDKNKLAEVDRSFVCPESLPDAARQDAVKQYIIQVRDAWPDASVDDMIAYRKFLLKKHNCAKTLEAIERQDR